MYAFWSSEASSRIPLALETSQSLALKVQVPKELFLDLK